MTTFLGIEKGQGETFAILEDFEILKIGRFNLHIRIRNLKRSGADTTEEEKALTSLNEAYESGNI